MDGAGLLPVPPMTAETEQEDRYEHSLHVAQALCARAANALPTSFDGEQFIAAVGPAIMSAMEVGVTFARRHPDAAEDWQRRYVVDALREAGALDGPAEVREHLIAEQARLIAEGCASGGDDE